MQEGSYFNVFKVLYVYVLENLMVIKKWNQLGMHGIVYFSFRVRCYVLIVINLVSQLQISTMII